MNEDQIVACRYVLQAVLRRPISKLFWECDDDIANSKIETPISLSIISTKLNKGIYSIPSEFIADMRQVFINGDSYDSEDSIKPAAVRLLLEDFENALSYYSPSLLPISIKLKFLLNKLELAIPKQHTKSIAEQIVDTKPGNVFFNPKMDGKYSIAELIDKISLLKSSDLLIKVIAYIYHIRPEAVILSYGVSIKFDLIEQEELKKISLYVDEILLRASIGEIDGFSCEIINETNPAIHKI